PDHHINYLSVQISLISLYLFLDFNYLVDVRTSPRFEKILKDCNLIKDIREAAKNYPNLKQELNHSLQPVKELLNSIFSYQNLKNKLFTTINAATTEDIDQIFDAILKLDKSILKSNKT
ncbi:1064_t:CDS:2, partial [Cetraspora pellucida]